MNPGVVAVARIVSTFCGVGLIIYLALELNKALRGGDDLMSQRDAAWREVVEYQKLIDEGREMKKPEKKTRIGIVTVNADSGYICFEPAGQAEYDAARVFASARYCSEYKPGALVTMYVSAQYDFNEVLAYLKEIGEKGLPKEKDSDVKCAGCKWLSNSELGACCYRVCESYRKPVSPSSLVDPNCAPPTWCLGREPLPGAPKEQDGWVRDVKGSRPFRHISDMRCGETAWTTPCAYDRHARKLDGGNLIQKTPGGYLQLLIQCVGPDLYDVKTDR